MSDNDKLLLLVRAFFLFMVAALAIATACGAFASPPPGTDLNSAIHKWFEEQHVPSGDPQAGMSCCSYSDGHILEEEDWRIRDQHYEIRVGEGWYRVRDTQVLSTNNPTGKPVAWYNKYSSGVVIFCFTPGYTT